MHLMFDPSLKFLGALGEEGGGNDCPGCSALFIQYAVQRSNDLDLDFGWRNKALAFHEIEEFAEALLPRCIYIQASIPRCRGQRHLIAHTVQERRDKLFK